MGGRIGQCVYYRLSGLTKIHRVAEVRDVYVRTCNIGRNNRRRWLRSMQHLVIKRSPGIIICLVGHSSGLVGKVSRLSRICRRKMSWAVNCLENDWLLPIYWRAGFVEKLFRLLKQLVNCWNCLAVNFGVLVPFVVFFLVFKISLRRSLLRVPLKNILLRRRREILLTPGLKLILWARVIVYVVVLTLDWVADPVFLTTAWRGW